jgi:hypothetical protein
MDDVPKIRALLICGFALVLLSGASLTYAQTSQEKKTQVSNSSISAEQSAIYGVVLRRYLSGGDVALNLASRTAPIETEGPFAGHDCSQGLAMEPIPPTVVHFFKPDDLVRLRLTSVRLVDQDQQRKEVEKNDPGKAIRKGVSVGDAVRNGFGHHCSH